MSNLRSRRSFGTLSGPRPSGPRRWVAVVMASVIASTFLLPLAALATDSGWIKQADQTVMDSANGLEDTNAHPDRTNLCEGTGSSDIDILFATDPPWVRVSGSPDPHTPFTEAEGQILPDAGSDQHFFNPFVTHTDAFFDHYTKDINAFITLDKRYRGLLATGNFGTGEDNERAQMEIEWERGGIPNFAFPTAGERIHVWGNHIWDCGHDDGGVRAEIHPAVGWVNYRNLANTNDVHGTPSDAKRLEDPWVWYENSSSGVDRQGIGATLPSTGLLDTPVQTTVADAFFSSWGGQAMEALNGCRDQGIHSSSTTNAPCTTAATDASHGHWFQPVLDQDYTFFIPAPPKPSGDVLMVYASVDRCGEVPSSPANPPGNQTGVGTPPQRMFGDIEDVGEASDASADIGSVTCGTIPDAVSVTTKDGQPGIEVTVKAKTGGATYPANDYVAFAKRYKVSWDVVPQPAQQVHTYRVDLNHLRVYDDNEPCADDGEWVMSIQVNEKWIYPVRGHGDDNDPFWATGAVDDAKCGGSGDYKEYSIGESLTVSVVPGQELRIRERSYDVDFFSNDLNPVVDAVVAGAGSYEIGDTNDSDSGAHTIGFVVTDITDALPPTGPLTIGTPQYGPNADTGGLTRISAAAGHTTPITFTAPGGVGGFESRSHKAGDPIPAGWDVDLNAGDGFGVGLPGAAADSGDYIIDWACIQDYGGSKIVSPRQQLTVQVDNTPPALTVPADFQVFSTSAAGAIVTYTTSASDNLPGPVTSGCLPASGSLFPNGKNAPLTTTVTCTATDAVGNQETRTFDVTVKSPFGYMGDFVVLGRDWARLASGVVVRTGNVGAFDASGGVPNSGGFEVVAGPSAVLTGGPQIAAESVRLDNSTTAGDVFYVDRISAGNGAAALPKIGYVPLFTGMPNVPGVSSGSVDRTLSGTQTLGPGSYGALTIMPNAIVTFTGGTYGFSSIELKPGAEWRFSGATTVGVTGRALLGNGTRVGPASGSGVRARDIVLYTLGSDGPPKKPGQAITIGSQAQVELDAYAPNGTLSIGSQTNATGAFLGMTVDVATGVTLDLDSAFLAP